MHKYKNNEEILLKILRNPFWLYEKQKERREKLLQKMNNDDNTHDSMPAEHVMRYLEMK